MSKTFGILFLSLKEDDTITTKTTYAGRFAQHGIFRETESEACPICGTIERHIDSRKAEVTCVKCGCVIEENMIDRGPEWRAFDHEQRDRRARTGAPLTYTISDKGLTTTIDNRNRDSNGRNIPEANKAQIYRLRQWQARMRIANASERNLAFALSELDRESSRLSIPRSIREDAAMIYRKAARKKLIRGRSIESMVAAALYMACRRYEVPRTLDEMSGASSVSKKQIGKNYRFLSRELKIKLRPTSPSDYIPRFASKLGLSGEVQAKAIEIVRKAKESGVLNGKGPTGVAATALYISSILLGERKTQRDIADVAGITEVTIRNRYKEIAEEVDLGVTI